MLVPTRPPAEGVVQRPSNEMVREAFKTIIGTAGIEMECITGEEGESFFFTDNVADDLLDITSVHPIKKDVIEKMLDKRGIDKSVIKNLVKKGMIDELDYQNKKFYAKCVGKRR